jgi:hypothetical protein
MKVSYNLDLFECQMLVLYNNFIECFIFSLYKTRVEVSYYDIYLFYLCHELQNRADLKHVP